MANTINAETRLIEEGALCPNPCDSKASPGPRSTSLVKLFENRGRRWKTKRSMSCPSNEKWHEEGGFDQLQRSSPTETSKRRRQLLPNNAPRETPRRAPNARHHQDGDNPDQGGHTLAGNPAIRK